MTIENFIQNVTELFSRLNKLEKGQFQITEKLNEMIDVAYRKRNEELGDLVLQEPDVEKLLGVSSRWLRELRKKGEIGFIPISDKKILYRQSDINDYLERKRIQKLNKYQ